MENPVTAWNIYQRTNIFDISYLPTRIQDIPKEVLQLYGLVVFDEEQEFDRAKISCKTEEDDGEPGILVIDEDRDVKPVSLQISVGKTKPRTKKMAKSSFDILNTPFAINVGYCHMCRKIIDGCTEEEHRRQHCSFGGCPDLILSEQEREKHRKIHSYPVKPIQCRFCKKRYRFYCNLERHFPNCKSKKARESKELLKKLQTDNNYQFLKGI